MTWAEVEALRITYEECERLHISWADMESGEAREKALKDRAQRRQENVPYMAMNGEKQPTPVT